MATISRKRVTGASKPTERRRRFAAPHDFRGLHESIHRARVRRDHGPLTLEPVPGCRMGFMDEGRGLLKAGMLARQAGVSTDTLRYYERQRLLPPPPRATNGYRAYPASALARVQLIRRALALGI